ncbi:DLW-39 family protein [Pseudonocardia sp. H11422]|nr:DLW-39 family protein [Pseudonocardia sp. H11422]
MKKLLALVAVAGVAFLVLSKVRASRSESDLWHEATTR